VLAGLLAGAGPAAAQEIYGHLEAQYQKTDVGTVLLRSDGSSYLTRQQREVWLQAYEANHQAFPHRDMLLQTQLRFNRQDEAHGVNQVTTPEGNMRLYHPWFNLYGSYRPTKLSTELRTTFPDTVITSRLDTRFSEAHLTGHFAKPKLPQLDLDWVSRYRSDSGSPEKEYGRQQTARVAYQQDWFNVYAGVTRQRSERTGPVVVAPLDQRVANAGGAVSVTPRSDASLTLAYNLSDTWAGFSGQHTATTQTHSLNANGDWRFKPRWNSNFYWNYRHSAIRQNVETQQDDNEGAASVNYEPWKRGRVTGMMGLRTLHQFQQPDRYIKYVTEIVGSDGKLRPGWEITGQITNSNNWDPQRGNYSIQTFGVSTRSDYRRRAHLDANWQLASDSDTAAAGQRVNIDWGLRLDLRPLRSLNLTGGVRSTRYGNGLLDMNATTRSRFVSFTWQPVPGVTAVGTYTSTGMMPNDSPRNVTRSLSAQYARSERLRLTGAWTRSNQERANPMAGGLKGREVVSAHAQSSLNRRLTVRAGISESDPGQPQVSKQYDTTITWSFGR